MRLTSYSLGVTIAFVALHVIAHTVAKSSATNDGVRNSTRSELADDIDEDYNDESDDDSDGGGSGGVGAVKQSRHRNQNILRRVGVTYSWSRWEKWSKCANSCVQIKRRKCIERIQNSTDSAGNEYSFYPDAENAGCFGILKRFRLCKDERCKSNNRKLRDEQCEKFNTILYKGKFHNWLSYEKEHNECELYCRPSDSEIFINMNQSVTDGTVCNRPAVYYTHYYRRKAVCVEGICRAVHTSGAIRPATTYDSQQKCGSVLCRHVSELFSKPKLQSGYNYVATIPAGAMNLTIIQLSHSVNLVALKSTDDVFIINGDHRASDGGRYEFNDDVFEYNREASLITTKGPLSKPVVLLLLVNGLNVGLKYNYTIPMPSASITEEEELQTYWDELGKPVNDTDAQINVIEGSAGVRIRDRKRRKFSWKLLGFGQCNRSCGPSVQTPIFRCIRDSPVRYYSPKRCASVEKPVFSDDIYQCNRGLCPAYWQQGDYGVCKCNEGSTEGVRNRSVICVQEQINGNIEEVLESQCVGHKAPNLLETCICERPLRRKIHSRDPGHISRVYSRLLSAPAEIRSVYNSSTTLRRNLRDSRSDKAGVWLMSMWHGVCSTRNCTDGSYQHRSIYCDRLRPKNELCDLRHTPDQKQSCPPLETLTCQQGRWYTSDWSACSGDCFSLERSRIVLCLRGQQVVSDEQCNVANKPSAVKSCMLNEVDYCNAQWHYSDWSECSRMCGEGIQRRYAKCLDFDWRLNSLVESNNCKYLERQPVYRTCNLEKCGEDLKTNLVESDGDTSVGDDYESEEAICIDEFKNCERIIRQGLCRLQYYKTYCCRSCREN